MGDVVPFDATWGEQPLRRHLAAGGDPRDLWGGDELFMIEVLRDVVVAHPEVREQAAACHRHEAEVVAGMPGDDREGRRQRFRLRTLVEAEMCEDPALVDAVAERLPAELAEQLRWLIDVTRRPFPLRVEPPDPAPVGRWSCGNCGASHPNDVDALVIRHREGWSRLDDPLIYCADCVAQAAEALA